MSHEIEVGQLWTPKPGAPAGTGLVRICARYPFPTHENETAWIVEHMGYAGKFERIPDKTLEEYWHLSDKRSAA